MSYQIIQDTFILFLLGGVGWLIFETIRFPASAFLGTIFVIGALRIGGIDLPAAPGYLSSVVQLILGIYVGSKIKKDTIRQLKTMITPAAMIIAWATAIVFLLGKILTSTTGLDLYTAMLSSSMGGLPEMSILAMSTNAKIEIIIIVHLFRVVLTLIAFPILLTYFVPRSAASDAKVTDEGKKISGFFGQKISFNHAVGCLQTLKQKETVGNLWWVLVTLVVAASGGFILTYLGVPAGVMVGAMLFAAIASLLGAKIKAPGQGIFSFLMIGAGITVSDSITPETLTALSSGNLLLIVLISTVVIFLSSLVVAFFISKVTRWDYATSFLAAAPAGFTVMTMLAVKYDRDPFRVSILHLCRLISLKMVLPLFFMFSDKV